MWIGSIRLISNSASQHVKGPIAVHTENISIEHDRVVILLTVPEGIDKPYFDNQGVIWLKSGSDKRRIHSKEELRRLFQEVDLLHADFIDDRDGCLFISLVERPIISSPRKKEILEKRNPINDPINDPINTSLSELQARILMVMEENPWIAYEDIAEKLEKDRSTIKRNIQQLKSLGVLERLGSKKSGSWKIIK